MDKIVTRAFIVDEEGNVLLGQRARGAEANRWALIGGKPDAGESYRETIVREVKEEIGVEFTPKFWKRVLDTSTDKENPWQVYLYIGTIKGELQLNTKEILKTRYVSSEGWKKLDIAFNHRELLELFFKEFYN